MSSRLGFRVLSVSAIALGALAHTLSGASAGESPIEARMLELAKDPDPRVRFQAALSLGEIQSPKRVEALAAIALQDGSDPWVRSAILTSIGAEAREFLERLIPELGPETQGLDTLVAEIARLIGSRGEAADIQSLVGTLSQPSIEAGVQAAALKGLSEGLNLSGAKMDGGAELAAALANLLASPSDTVRNAAIGVSARVLPQDSPALESLLTERIAGLKEIEGDLEAQIQSARILRLASYEKVEAPLVDLLSGLRPEAIQTAAIDTLSTFDRPEAGEGILRNWSQLAPGAKARALDLFFSRADRVLQLLAAIEAEAIPANILDSQRRTLLLSYSDARVSDKAKELFSAGLSGENPELYQKYAAALDLPGDREHGKKIYAERCAQCHVAEGEGYQLGPDWSALKSNTRETLLTSILYPNRELAPGFTNYIVETLDGDIYTGVLAFSGPNSVVLRRGGGQEDTILRKNIDILEDTRLSIMPTDLELGLTVEDMASLLNFIESLD